MKVVGTGFLSSEGLREAQEIQRQLHPLLDAVGEAIRLSQEALQKVTIAGQLSDIEKQKVIACVMLARILEISESMVLLARSGFSVETMAALRNFLDAYFIFGNICKEPSSVPAYFATDLVHRQKLINSGIRRSSEMFESLQKHATPAVLDELKAEIVQKGAQEFQSYTYANNIGCAELYDSFYRIASAATHSTPRSLEEYVTEDDSGDVIELRRGPQLSDIPDRLFDVGNFLITVRKAFDELFEREETPEIEQVKTALDNAYCAGSWYES